MTKQFALDQLAGNGCAVHFDERSRRGVRRQAVSDESLAGRAPRLFCGAGEAALPEDRVGVLEVALRLGQRGLALHHARARLVAELLDHVCRDCHRRHNFSDSSLA